MSAAYAAGVGGPGFLWFGSDAVTNDRTWAAVPNVSAVFKGFFGLSPSAGITSQFLSYRRRLQAFDVWPGNGTGQCNDEVDGDGRYIWQQDVDGDPSTPPECSSFDAAPDTYSPFAYDAVFAIARALHKLIEIDGQDSILGSDLRRALIEDVSFVGVTGEVGFVDGTSIPNAQRDGDREVGIRYSLLNYQPAAAGLMEVGAWLNVGHNSTWEERYTPNDILLVYSTNDNSKPGPRVPTHEQNLVPTAVFVMANTLTGLAIALAVAFFSWTLYFRHDERLKGLQPRFLLLVALGCCTSLATTFPMARDHASERALQTVADERTGSGIHPSLDASCNIQLWLYCSGFVITYGTRGGG